MWIGPEEMRRARSAVVLLAADAAASGAQPGGAGDGRFGRDVGMEEVAREGLGPEGCDGCGQAVPQGRPPGRVVPRLLACGGDIRAELVAVGDASSDGCGLGGIVWLRGAADGMDDRAGEREVHGWGVRGGEVGEV